MDMTKIKLSKILTVAALSAATAVSTLPVSAKTVQTGDYEITSSGTINAKANEEVTMDVYHIGKSQADLTEGLTSDELMKIVLRRDQMTVGDNGRYEFKFKVGDIQSGEYTVYISRTNVSGAEGVIKETFTYRNPNDYKTAIGLINNAASIEDLKKIINDYADILEIDLSQEEKADDTLTVMLASAKKQSLDSADIKSALNCFKLSKIVLSINDKSLTDFNNVSDVVDLSKADLKDWYAKSYVSADVKSNMISRMAAKKIKTVSDMYAEMPEAFVLAVVEQSGSVDGIKEVINGFSEEVGANVNGLTERKLLTLSGKNYASYAALKTDIQSLKNSGSSGGGSSSGGSSGGSGGSFGGVKSYPDNTQNNNNNNNKEDKELNYYVFDDLDSVEWAKEAICALAEKGVVRGKEYKTFYPNDLITREEFVKIIIGAFGIDTTGAESDFEDASKDDWFYPYVSAAYNAKLINGVSDKLFGTGQNITRQDLAVIAYNAAKNAEIKFKDTDVFKFSDDNDIADYAKDAVYALKSQDIINGVDGRNFAPNDTATRAEAAKIVYLLISLLS